MYLSVFVLKDFCSFKNYINSLEGDVGAVEENLGVRVRGRVGVREKEIMAWFEVDDTDFLVMDFELLHEELTVSLRVDEDFIGQVAAYEIYDEISPSGWMPLRKHLSIFYECIICGDEDVERELLSWKASEQPRYRHQVMAREEYDSFFCIFIHFFVLLDEVRAFVKESLFLCMTLEDYVVLFFICAA